MFEMQINDVIARLRERARIRLQIPTRKSVQEGKPDRIAQLLEESAAVLAKTAYQRERALCSLRTYDGALADHIATLEVPK